MRLKEMTVCCGGNDTAAAYENAYYLDSGMMRKGFGTPLADPRTGSNDHSL